MESSNDTDGRSAGETLWFIHHPFPRRPTCPLPLNDQVTNSSTTLFLHSTILNPSITPIGCRHRHSTDCFVTLSPLSSFLSMCFLSEPCSITLMMFTLGLCSRLPSQNEYHPIQASYLMTFRNRTSSHSTTTTVPTASSTKWIPSSSSSSSATVRKWDGERGREQQSSIQIRMEYRLHYFSSKTFIPAVHLSVFVHCLFTICVDALLSLWTSSSFSTS